MTCTTGTSGVQEFMETPVAEGGTCQFTGYLLDAAGNNLTLLQLATLKLTLTDVSTEDILGGRNAQDILNTNGGTVANVVVDGVTRLQFTLILSGADNAILDDEVSWETHMALIEWTYDGTILGRHELTFSVVRF